MITSKLTHPTDPKFMAAEMDTLKSNIQSTEQILQQQTQTRATDLSEALALTRHKSCAHKSQAGYFFVLILWREIKS